MTKKEEEVARIGKVKATIQPLHKQLSQIYTTHCHHCSKIVVVEEGAYLADKLGCNNFYCNFCTQQNFHLGDNKDILIMSFRGIIGYFYQERYQNLFNISYSQIEDMINAHVRIGLLNPVFRYDPATYLWFLDFSKVSAGAIPLSEIYKTTINIMACFNLYVLSTGFKTKVIWEKYKDAIDAFYKERYRPSGKKILKPTISGCFVMDNKNSVDLEKTKEFMAADFSLEF